ncbi:kinesin motor domain-containing protein [Thecamonas trahens ATCC 50062]|uniref:Kinesin motor domain-containing protein n=1 Tax=Thecamonas trahens ATCC 50062 TaxID=461836 RepID=A0A0L0DQX6_THETB|nr:kinesin motor domain-containing protein [Thecamonas trahens ATCC 50062]KNC54675.1 kinesin motor domain-containing protein [Thecamonas trahens ATCC 50062]|eukprot:XP_013761577.1 kinesin motor domain-containing protein [Thecamonas trahens ATCC 50062]
MRRGRVSTSARALANSDDRVSVFVRVRPLVGVELAGGPDGGKAHKCVVLEPASASLALETPWDARVYSFAYDAVFDTTTPQDAVYAAVAAPVVEAVLEGRNGTVLAYGQTGTGKTHTLAKLEPLAEAGIIPRAVAHIFSYAAAHPDQDVRVVLSLLQLYRDAPQDLLARRAPDTAPPLSIRQLKGGAVYVQGLSKHPVDSVDAVLELLDIGYARRAIESTRLNDVSSRAHTILRLEVSRRDPFSGSRTHGVFTCVDLAGSERVKKSRSRGARLDEAKFINKSLTALGNVIASLADPGVSYIPYRDSKLTRLLQDSLGGNCVTALIVNIGPAVTSAHESVSSLQFGQRAMRVEARAHINYDETDADKSMAARLASAHAELNAARDRIRALEQAKSRLEARLHAVATSPVRRVVSPSRSEFELLETNAQLEHEIELLVAENEALRAQIRASPAASPSRRVSPGKADAVLRAADAVAVRARDALVAAARERQALAQLAALSPSAFRPPLKEAVRTAPPLSPAQVALVASPSAGAALWSFDDDTSPGIDAVRTSTLNPTTPPQRPVPLETATPLTPAQAPRRASSSSTASSPPQVKTPSHTHTHSHSHTRSRKSHSRSSRSRKSRSRSSRSHKAKAKDKSSSSHASPWYRAPVGLGSAPSESTGTPSKAIRSIEDELADDDRRLQFLASQHQQQQEQIGRSPLRIATGRASVNAAPGSGTGPLVPRQDSLAF